MKFLKSTLFLSDFTGFRSRSRSRSLIKVAKMSKRKSEQLSLTPTNTSGAQYRRESTPPDGCDKAERARLLARRRQAVKKSRDQLNAVVGGKEHAGVVEAPVTVMQDPLKDDEQDSATLTLPPINWVLSMFNRKGMWCKLGRHELVPYYKDDTQLPWCLLANLKLSHDAADAETRLDLLRGEVRCATTFIDTFNDDYAKEDGFIHKFEASIQHHIIKDIWFRALVWVQAFAFNFAGADILAAIRKYQTAAVCECFIDIFLDLTHIFHLCDFAFEACSLPAVEKSRGRWDNQPYPIHELRAALINDGVFDLLKELCDSNDFDSSTEGYFEYIFGMWEMFGFKAQRS
jgi:hypothetical protein